MVSDNIRNEYLVGSKKLLASSRVHHVPVAHRFFTDDGIFQLHQLVLMIQPSLSKNQNLLKKIPRNS